MNATKRTAAKTNAASLTRQIASLRSQIATATFAARPALMNRLRRLENARVASLNA